MIKVNKNERKPFLRFSVFDLRELNRVIIIIIIMHSRKCTWMDGAHE